MKNFDETEMKRKFSLQRQTEHRSKDNCNNEYINYSA